MILEIQTLSWKGNLVGFSEFPFCFTFSWVTWLAFRKSYKPTAMYLVKNNQLALSMDTYGHTVGCPTRWG